MDEMIGLGFTRGVLDVCLYLGCSDICGKWVGGLEQGLEGWGCVTFV